MIKEIKTKLDLKCDCKSCQFQNLVFENLKDVELESLCLTKKTVSFKKGEFICKEGDPINDFHYLKSGLVKLYRTRNNKDHIITIAKPFDFVSLLTVFSDENYHYSVTALEDSEVCIIELSEVRRVIQENGSFALGIIKKMSHSSDNIIKSTTDLGSKNMRGRIAYILLYFANEVYKKDSFDLPVSRREIAELIEMTTENVIRVLSEFRKDKLLSIDGKNINILNKKMLESLSNFG